MKIPIDKLATPYRWAALLVVLLLLCGACLVLMKQPHTPDVQTVEMQSLVLKDGRLFLQDSDQAFTGFVMERFPDGAIRARSEVREGRLHGLSEGWFADGTLEIREQYEHGVAHGKRERFDSEGRRISEAEIKRGELHGTFREFHPNGKVARIITMDQGKPTGTHQAFYPNGRLRAEVTFEDHEMVSQTFWDEYGEVMNTLPNDS